MVTAPMTAANATAFAMDISSSSATPPARPLSSMPGVAATVPPTAAAPANETLIDIDHVDFYYGANRALHDINLKIDAKKVTGIFSPMLYGLMTEEINHCYDGGLYAELIQNRVFKDDPKAPVHWSVVTTWPQN